MSAAVLRADPEELSDARLTIEVSRNADDAAWDAFVARMPDARHVQASHWARLKSRHGWSTLRIIARQNYTIVGGAQMFVRPLSWMGRMAYIAHGPLLSAPDPLLAEALFDTILNTCMANRVGYLIVQPPPNGEPQAESLTRRHFRRSPASVAPGATIVLDLDRGIKEIMCAMHRQTRQNIRRALREGVVVRHCGREALDTFYSLYRQTSVRRDFSAYGFDYFEDMWDQLAPDNRIHLFIGHHSGEDVTGLLVVAYGNRVYAKSSGWTGKEGTCRPNDATFWAAIEWAATAGYKWFDFEGFDPDLAVAIKSGKPLPAWWHQSPSFFKFGFGGEVCIYPSTYYLVFNPLLRALLDVISRPFFARIPILSNAHGGFHAAIQRLGNSVRTHE